MEKTKSVYIKIIAGLLAVTLICGMLFLLPFVRNFMITVAEYFMHRQLTHEVWHERIFNLGTAVIKKSIITALLVFIFMQVYLQVMKYKKEIICFFSKFEFNNIFENYKKTCTWIFLILIVSFSSLIIANSPYIDDYERIMFGNNMGTPWSRYTACFIANTLNTNSFLLDISPFTQILSIVLISISACIIIYGFNGNNKVSFHYIIAVLPLGVFPYYLQCMSYKFDSAYNMAFSVFFSVIPVLFTSSIVLFSILTLICTLLMCTTYQASCGLFPVLMVLITLYKLNTEGSKKETWKILGMAVISYFIALTIFKLFICTNYESYASSKLMPANKIVSGFFYNLFNYWKVCLSDMRPLWKVSALISFLVSIVLSIAKSKMNLKISVIINLLGFSSLLFICLGVYPALNSENKFAARYMIGFGLLLTCLFVYFCSICSKYNKKIISLFVILPVSWSMCVFALFYGNAMHQNDLYNQYRMGTIINDLNNFDFMNNGIKKKICIQGLVEKPEIFTHKPFFCVKLLDKLLSSSLDHTNWIQMLYFNNYFNIPDFEWEEVTFKDKESCLIKSTMYQNYYYDGEQLLIELKR